MSSSSSSPPEASPDRPGGSGGRAMRAAAIWGALALVTLWPLAVALGSPLLEWRGPVYVVAGAAGVVALALLPVQPLMAAGWLPGPARPRRVHRAVGLGLVAAVAVHVGGLWLTSPPDVVDALTFASPTPFSAWGVVAMWAVALSAAMALLRRRLGWRPAVWRSAHTLLAGVIVSGGVVHALLIVGTMGPVSKAVLSAAAVAALGAAALRLRAWRGVARRRHAPPPARGRHDTACRPARDTGKPDAV